MNGDLERRWRVGELAEAAGVSVRTLRHYDSIGLVRPAHRSASGYREYTGRDVRRLYQVLALRSLGLRLDEVRSAIDADGDDLLALVERQIQRVDAQIRFAERLRARLGAMAMTLRTDHAPPFTAMLEVLEVMAMVNRYYTPEQLEALEQRANDLGPQGLRAAESAWTTLIAEVEAARAANVDPASDAAQALAARWQALIEEFTGGDPGIRASLQALYEGEGSAAASQGAVSTDLMAYVQAAIEAGANAS